ncbi:MAG: C4-type zinc ribbon domain-containing protein [Candidatus Cloacimonadaceae bacterium]|jgi:predicted  nucleic acid-binding Zn-ribbon protein|nr:C4-type zinc ribbon domain-containing protein [Candidatus Cloacimonadota bacterium]MDY0128195.1 C4-type zinc ribbon domain-containing protein [Candidatus Cloacimonadaceae bacterium]MCB5255786.1 C4-type zinc ribbon domain-containing protein [Candidatus Cloacimonadota bacterium]MCK9179193.1 C4-type zinc ribbon domain-containing protein [Candidatus Cloacimonadota bacterium]MCK9242736.1 C4-type zinc ribbon domain-containing protein [Candidatus Cloacimonadota bacterium]
MEERLRTLAAMQKLDDKIGQYRILQDVLPKQLNEINEKVEQATIDLLAGETEKAELNKLQRALESEIKTHQAQINKYATQLSEIKTNKEYKALNSEIAYLKEKISEIESQLLEHIDTENEIKSRIVEYKKVLGEAEANKKAKEGDLKAQIDTLEGKIESTRAERNKLAVTLPVALIKRYGNLIKNKENQAVAYSHDGSCGGCGFVIRQQMRIELQLRKKVVYCENCGRILLNPIPEEDTQQAE